MLYISKNTKAVFYHSEFETSPKFINVFCLCKIHFHEIGQLNLMKTMLKSFPILLDFVREKALLTLHVVTEMHFLLQKNLRNIMHGRVKMYVMR